MYDLLSTGMWITQGEFRSVPVFETINLNAVPVCSFCINCDHVLLQEKLGVYFLSKMDSDNPKVQEVSASLVI